MDTWRVRIGRLHHHHDDDDEKQKQPSCAVERNEAASTAWGSGSETRDDDDTWRARIGRLDH